MKSPRTIAARGLTRSNVGSVIEYRSDDGALHNVRIADVSYDPARGHTVVEYVTRVSIPDLSPVQIVDK